MSRNNDVFQVLVLDAEFSPAAADITLDDLLVGQFGVFDYHTNLSVDASVKDFYFAVKYVNADGQEDIAKSSGTHIQTKNVIESTKQCYVAPANKILTLSDWVAQCNTEYGVRFEIRNQEAYRLNGYNQVVKYYSVMSPDCVPCNTDCPDGDCAAVANDLMAVINSDPDGVISASVTVDLASIQVTTPESTGGTVTTTIAGYDVVSTLPAAGTAAENAAQIAADINTDGTYAASIDPADDTIVNIYSLVDQDGANVESVKTTAIEYVAALGFFVTTEFTSLDDLPAELFADACPDLTFTVAPGTFSNFCDINLNYFFPRQTDVIAVATGGFEGNSTITTTQEMVYEDGAGYDIKQLEYEAGGWNGRPGPYRVGELIGTAFPGFLYFADVSKQYDVIHVQHDQVSVSGWRVDDHFERTIIALDNDGIAGDVITALIGTMVNNTLEPCNN